MTEMRTARVRLAVLAVAAVGAVVAGTVAMIPASADDTEGTTYYVDSSGADSASGKKTGTAWKSLDKVNDFDFKPGDSVLFKRGSTWEGTLRLDDDGTKAAPVTVGAYGEGDAPVFTAADNCVEVDGDNQVIEDIRATDCSWAGIELRGSQNEVRNVQSDKNVVGVSIVDKSKGNKVTGSKLVDNDKMSVNDPGGDNDSGAFGVLLNGDDNTISGNTITGSFAESHDYGYDGAAVEIFNGDRNVISHNVTADNETFTELGHDPGGTADDNVFAYNSVTSTQKTGAFLVTRGEGVPIGPVKGTVAVNNSVNLTTGDTAGWVCHDGCSPDILKLRNNIIKVTGNTGFEDGEGADENNGVYSGKDHQFELGDKSVKDDPKFTSDTDLHLTEGSPAIGLGEPAGYDEDLDGNPVGDKPDAGCYQSK
ncbi:hypothetical protein [Stackebrandtia nassauensis]|uniref:Right handed beta helix domain-containing protein n=1 Tax=Stackebrandtia nassauensis (strain DSM 44728 / CIP 108903 / NRRL B-16338 / NBRC 102104 / LLR-40K-21) TaxID=446470 RepID=D3QAS6_STANL|nr:hypothetical protein [Stackebrandtia nassauensis]ADD44722.1 hypothetical protein Snas_5086 [Stackebrandtia nassauensis DSM 44728]